MFCLSLYFFRLAPPPLNTWTLFSLPLPSLPSAEPPPNSKLVYLPTCVVLVSKSPHFQFQKDALSGYAILSHSQLLN